MKAAIWLYLFLFVAFFDLHAQYPILTPFAISLGAAPSFIGLMMGMYSITHLPGNIAAGYSVDRFGSRIFIVLSLMFAGIILLFQAHVSNPWQLLVLRSFSGFVLAFLSPACLALLARMTSDLAKQGKLMAGNGLVHTLASVISPAAGALLVAQIGFSTAFYALGWILIGTSICALFFIRDIPALPEAPAAGKGAGPEALKPAPAAANQPEGGIPWLVYALPIATSCAQGILSFELPLMGTGKDSILTTGLLFSVVSLGALITLSMLFLNRLSPFMRTLWGALLLAILYYGIAAGVPLPLAVMLLLLGMAKGIVLPAIPTLLIEQSGGKRYGRTFSILSIAYSIGAFLGPVLAGQLRDQLSPYYIAFLVLMVAVSILPFYRKNRTYRSNTHFSRTG
ncbi:MFS transporter [Paenibacillus protaetiae]|uniref:MFS transporter n=1 Tax=Paenibacillus protaetiae TaxID=2509456 RepID=A0A4P6EYL7_9BACL|nr:MFS transporter [Paenibacillus protaetiae]QAY68202.1 MFS transporter [Paenibacillus protaetiae]